MLHILADRPLPEITQAQQARGKMVYPGESQIYPPQILLNPIHQITHLLCNLNTQRREAVLNMGRHDGERMARDKPIGCATTPLADTIRTALAEGATAAAH